MANSLFKFWNFHLDELQSVSLSIYCLYLLHVQYFQQMQRDEFCNTYYLYLYIL
jgi:hypothetical protein